MIYSKPPLSLQEQIQRLKDRGLTFGNEVKAAHYLSNISNYRLRAYTYPFQDNSDPNHPFLTEMSFEDLISLYVFDRKLRILIFNGIEKIEIALRTKIIYEYSIGCGNGNWYEDETMYYDHIQFEEHMETLLNEIDRSNETFIDHYKTKYTQPENPPAWMALEVASFGLLSKIYRNLLNTKLKTKVAREFGLTNSMVLSSWMFTFSNMRNIVAHHGRLWNRRFVASVQLPTHTLRPFLQNTNIYPNKLYALMSCMNFILQEISPGNCFVADFKNLIKTSDFIFLHEMGFPADWENESIWQ